jgi:hypothetical protein
VPTVRPENIAVGVLHTLLTHDVHRRNLPVTGFGWIPSRSMMSTTVTRYTSTIAIQVGTCATAWRCLDASERTSASPLIETLSM